MPCRLCIQNHPEKYCSLLKSAQPIDRYNMVLRNNLCLNCLSRRHLARDCDSLNRCFYCNDNHHTSICLAACGVLRPMYSGSLILPIIKCRVSHASMSTTLNLLVSDRHPNSFIFHYVLRDLLPGQEGDRKISSIPLRLSTISTPRVTFNVVMAIYLSYSMPKTIAPTEDCSNFLNSLRPLANVFLSNGERIDGQVGPSFINLMHLPNRGVINYAGVKIRPTYFGYLVSGAWVVSPDTPEPPNLPELMA